MQDPNLDTEWNDVLRAKGVIEGKKEVEVTEGDIANLIDHTILKKTTDKSYHTMTLDELDEKEDDIDEDDERMFEEYRRQRLAEMATTQKTAFFGDVREISRDEYVDQVNKAGESIYVVLLVYKQSVPLCKLLEQYIEQLSQLHRGTKFLKSVASVCIPNYPDKNLPTIFVYLNGDMKKQFVGPLVFGGMKLTRDELEWMLSQTGAFKTHLEEDPHKKVDDFMTSSLRTAYHNEDTDDDD